MSRRLWSTILAVLAVGLTGCVMASSAWADGDPGSDVLVYQDLFVGSDAGLSVGQQVSLGALLKAARGERFPIRVAIIAGPNDLGSVTALWRQPQAYARFLGLELSLAYRQRLLVVMPNGLGFYWSGHPAAPAYARLAQIAVRPGPSGLFTAAQTAVRALAGAGGIKLAARSAASSSPVAPPASAGHSGRATDRVVGTVALALLALAGLAIAARRVLAGRGSGGGAPRPRRASTRSSVSRRAGVRLGRTPVLVGALLLCMAAAAAPLVVLASNHGLRSSSPPLSSQATQLAANPYVDPGTPVSGLAPDFTLSDQFGRAVSLSSFRGKVVMLAFNDSQCTTICPLTTTAMLEAKAMLGQAGSRVQLLGVDANPAATSLEDVLSYSQLHGMLHAWHFLTGPLSQLRRVWKAYGVDAAIARGQITHTPALFVIDPHGRQAKVYLTQASYASIDELGKVLATEAASLLPGHPPVHSNLSYAPIKGVSPSASATLPRAGGGSVALGPGRAAHLYLFFATWDQGVTSLAGHLLALNAYQAHAVRSGLPALTAVDEASVEPSPGALVSFLARLPRRLSYPVGIDGSGRIADGYQVQGEPWYVLTSASGRILWYWQVSPSGWLTRAGLVRQVRAALARAPSAPATAASADRALAGSPAALAELHAQAGSLLGSEPALAARLRALRGYPVVVNAWASWCPACRAEFGLFVAASARYGRRIAFLGADTDDVSGDAQAFLAQHPVSYPSYQTTTGDLRLLASIYGLPTTIFIDSAGKVTYVHAGQYDSQGTLNADIGTYARGG